MGSSHLEPLPGWIEGVHGMTIFLLNVGLGVLGTLLCDDRCIIDMIPVDIVSNTLITAASANKDIFAETTNCTVINCISGATNPLTFKGCLHLVMKWARTNPFERVLQYPSGSYRTSKTMNFLIGLIVHFLPALCFDAMARLKGKRPRMVKKAAGVEKATDRVAFFMSRDWHFKVGNMKRIMDEVDAAADGDEYYCDVSKVNWSDYMRDYMLGIRRLILKEKDDTLPSTRRKIIR